MKKNIYNLIHEHKHFSFLGKRRHFWRNFLVIFFSAVTFLGVSLMVTSIDTSQAFDWDESVYLLKARSWTHGTPGDSFYVYRPVGMSFVASGIAHFTDFTTENIRFFGVFFAGVYALFLFLFVAKISRIALGVLSVVVLVNTSLFLENAPLFQNDIVSSGLLLGVLWCIWRHYKSDGRDHSLYLAALLAAGAFYLRYGVILHLSVIGVVTGGLFLMRMYLGKHSAGKRVFRINPSLKACVIFVLLLLPHFVYSMMLFNRDPLGILRYAGSAAHRDYIGEGFLDYVAWLPESLAGTIVGVLALSGIFGVALLFIWRRKSYVTIDEVEVRGMYWIMSIAAITFVLIGLLVHAEERYILFPFTLFVVCGVWFYYTLFERLWPFLGVVFVVFLAAFSVVQGQDNLVRANALFDVQEEYRSSIISGGDAIRKHAQGRECFVWTTEEPQVSWHSGCRVFTYKAENYFELLNVYRDELKYLVVFSETDKVQPAADALIAQGVLLQGVESDDPRVSIYRVIYAGDGGTERITQ